MHPLPDWTPWLHSSVTDEDLWRLTRDGDALHRLLGDRLMEHCDRERHEQEEREEFDPDREMAETAILAAAALNAHALPVTALLRVMSRRMSHWFFEADDTLGCGRRSFVTGIPELDDRAPHDPWPKLAVLGQHFQPLASALLAPGTGLRDSVRHCLRTYSPDAEPLRLMLFDDSGAPATGLPDACPQGESWDAVARFPHTRLHILLDVDDDGRLCQTVLQYQRRRDPQAPDCSPPVQASPAPRHA